MKKLHTQERAVEEVKLAIKPYYQRKDINKDEYKDILRKAVHKVGGGSRPLRDSARRQCDARLWRPLILCKRTVAVLLLSSSVWLACEHCRAAI